MSRSAMRGTSVNYAGERALSPDARAIARRECLKIHATELLKEVTV